MNDYRLINQVKREIRFAHECGEISRQQMKSLFGQLKSEEPEKVCDGLLAARSKFVQRQNR